MRYPASEKLEIIRLDTHAASGNFRGVRLRKLSQGNNGSDQRNSPLAC